MYFFYQLNITIEIITMSPGSLSASPSVSQVAPLKKLYEIPRTALSRPVIVIWPTVRLKFARSILFLKV